MYQETSRAERGIMREVAVIGAGIHPWGKFPNKSFVELGTVAARNALESARVEWKDIQSAVAGCWVWGGTDGLNAGPRLAAALGGTGIPIANVFNMCGTPATIFREAYFQVASGAVDIAMAVGLDKSPPGFFATMGKENPDRFECVDTDWLRWKMIGVTNPAYWAMECRERMSKYGTTDHTLAMCKVQASKHGALNPQALYRKIYTAEEVLNSPMVCDPLRLYMICATRDGAAAVILCSMDTARQYTNKPIKVAGVSLGSGMYGDPTRVLGLLSAPSGKNAIAPMLSESYSASQQAYKMAGVGPEDIDFVELPDGSAWHYLQYLELLNFCEPGGADALVEDGETVIGGKIPVCVSGGASSWGEAICAEGLAEVDEIMLQLRGEAGERQVKGAKVAMIQSYGQLGNSGSIILTK